MRCAIFRSMLVRELTDLTFAVERSAGHPLMAVACVEAGEADGDACIGMMYELASRYAPHVVFCELDLGENPSMRGQLRIHTHPTVILYERGEESRRFAGPGRFEEIDAALREAMNSKESDDV